MRDIWKCTSCFSASAKAPTFLLSLRPSFRQAPFPLLFLFPFLFPFPWNDFFNQQDRGSLTSSACTERWQTPSPLSDWFGGRKARKRQKGNQNWILKGKVLNVWGKFSLADWGQSSQMDIGQTNPVHGMLEQIKKHNKLEEKFKKSIMNWKNPNKYVHPGCWQLLPGLDHCK